MIAAALRSEVEANEALADAVETLATHKREAARHRRRARAVARAIARLREQMTRAGWTVRVTFREGGTADHGGQDDGTHPLHH